MARDSANRITKSELAKRLSCTPAYITRLITRGVISVGGDGLIDFVQALHDIEAAQDPAQRRTRPHLLPPDLATATFHGSKALKEKYAALLRKVEYERLCGDLVPIADVVGTWERLVSAFRARMLSLPSMLATQLAHSIDESIRIQKAIDAAIREALQDLARFDLVSGVPARSTTGRSNSRPAAGPNRKPMGKRKSTAKPRGQRGARTVPVH
jgi:hypothetical protein